jgi:predicted MFS family arabinose efflux permease
MNRQTGLLTAPPSSGAGAERPPQPTVRSTAAPGARLTGTAGLVLLASIVVSFLSASSAPTPLYAVYQAEWGFTPITTTVVFGIYALAVLVALLTLGKVSDHVGRRPVLLTAIAGQAAAMIVFATASGVSDLLLARVVQGLATGAALGALGAAMIDISRDRGTLANAVVPGIGTGLGALVSGLAVQYLPAPQHLIYLALLGVLAVQAIGVLLLQETVTRKPGVLGTLVPDIKLPRATRGPVLVAAPVLIAVWSLAGFYGSLGPALTRRLTGSPSVVLGGLGLFLLAGVAASATFILRNVAPRRVMLAGIVALLAGVGLTLVAISSSSSALFFSGTVVAGFGFGAGFQGGIRTVVPLAAAHERSGVLSLIFVISYIGMGAPAVAAGYLVVHDGGLTHTAREYGIFVMALAVLALLGLVRRPSASPRPTS